VEHQPVSASKNELIYGLKTPKADTSTDKQMAQLYEEVN